MKDIIAIASKDSKHGFEFLGVREGSKRDSKGVKLWPFKMRAAAGQSNYQEGRRQLPSSGGHIYCNCCSSLKPEAKAPFAGKPIAGMEDIPTLAFHRTRPACWKRILEQGLIPGGGDFVGSDRAHVRCRLPKWTTRQISSAVAIKEGLEDGLIFFKNRTVDTIPPEYIVLVEDTDSKATLWSRVGSSGLQNKPADEGESSATVIGAPEPSVSLLLHLGSAGAGS